MTPARALALSALAVSATAVLLAPAHFGRGSFDHALVALAINAYAASGVAAVLLGTLLLRAWARRSGRSPGPSRIVPLCGAALALQLALAASFPLGRWLSQRDVDNAKRWCEQRVEQLEQVRQRSGEYPEHLPASAAAPRLFRTGDATYRRLDHGFEFVVLLRARSNRVGEAYTSSERRWRPRIEDPQAPSTPSAKH